MKSRFEKHDNQLFRMLEEPEPLTTDANLPCVVRLIQDDSRMGMFNRDTKPSRLSDFYLAARIINNNIIVDEFMESDYSRFEIIGYPVAEGSHWWALYQMMQGENICHNKAPSIVYCKPDLKIMRQVRYNCVDYMSASAWLNGADKSGWQIYAEPTPEPPKEPDYVICKRCGGTGYEIKEQKPDNLYLNIKPSNPVDWCFDKKNLLVLVDDNFKGIVGENVTREQVGEIAKLLTEPSPQYKVGDWVEIESSHTKGETFVSVIKEMPNQKHYTVHVNSFCGGHYGIMERQIVRKLKPSEVIVRIGCLSGTVERHDGNPTYWFKLRSSEYNYALISTEMLDAHTRKLVESLLKAQEDNNG